MNLFTHNCDKKILVGNKHISYFKLSYTKSPQQMNSRSDYEFKYRWETKVNLHALLAEGKEDLHIMTASSVGQLSPVVGVSTVVSTHRRSVPCLVCLDFGLYTLQRVTLPTAFNLRKDLDFCVLISINSRFKILHTPRYNDEFFICVKR